MSQKTLVAILFVALFTVVGLADARAESKCPQAKTLRQAGECLGKFMGAMVENQEFSDAGFRELVANEYSFVAGHRMLMKLGKPQDAKFDFGTTDPLMKFAESHKLPVMWHNLAWYLDVPEWMKKMPPRKMEKALKDIVEVRVAKYKGRVHSWITVNEALGDDGTQIKHDLYQKLGPDYVAKVFHWTHAIDPRARLFLNDHSMDQVGPKSDGAYKFVKGLVDRDVPIHGVGLQAHFNALHPPDRQKLEDNIKRFGDLGLEVVFTELDVRVAEVKGTLEEKLARQGKVYYDVAAACAAQPACRGVITWGVSDRNSWIYDFFAKDDHPLPFDRELGRKPAYYGLLHGITGQPYQGATAEAAPGHQLDECQASCAARECGDDGCGGCCGFCKQGLVCKLSKCVVAPECPKAPKDWPPKPEDLYLDGECRLPPCDENAPTCWDPGCPGQWERVLTTTASDCPTAVGWYDARGRVGNVKVEPQYVEVVGTCLKNEHGKIIGAVYNGISASCEATEQGMGVTAFEAGVVDLNQGGQGQGRVPIINIPKFVAFGSGSCTIEVDVLFRRKHSQREKTE